MSKFLTPPVWYDKNGNLNEMLTGNAGTSHDIAIGSSAEAGGGGIAIGGNAIDGGVAIGSGTTSWGPGCIAIGDGASTSAPTTIQLGNNNAAYTLNVGNGTGTINGVRLSANDGVIQLGSNTTSYTLNVGNGDGTISGYIESGIAVPLLDTHQGFEDVTYITDGASTNTKQSIKGGIYIVRVDSASYVSGYRTLCTFLFEIYTASEPIYSSPFRYNSGSGGDFAVVKATPVPNDIGMFTLSVVSDALSVAQELKYFTISVRLISESYSVG